MKQEHIDWIESNPFIFKNVRVYPEQLEMLFEIFNDLTGRNDKVTSCGRCVSNIKKKIKLEYEKVRNIQNSEGDTNPET